MNVPVKTYCPKCKSRLTLEAFIEPFDEARQDNDMKCQVCQHIFLFSESLFDLEDLAIFQENQGQMTTEKH